jgi:hypothetical protein
MPRASEIDPLKKLQILIYGRFRTGKTEGAATFPRPNFLSFDRGMDTVTTKGFAQRHPNVKLDDILYQDFFDLDSDRDKNGVPLNYNAYDDACRYFDAYMDPKGAKWKSRYDSKEYQCHPDMFDTWVIDSGTTLGSVAIAKGVILLGDKQFTGGKALSNTYDSAKKFGLIVPKQQDFAAERSLLEQFVKMVFDSGKHVILICHEKENTNDNGAVVERVPLLTGQSVERVCLLFDEVYRLQASKQGNDFKRSLQTKPDGIVRCGSRLDIPDGTEWDWGAVSSAIKNSTNIKGV